LRTLPIRLERVTNSTKKIVEYLKSNNRVQQVIFPHDPSFPQYQLAMKQMKGACGLVTFEIKVKNAATIETFCESLQHILMAVSWGGYESLIIPKCAGMKQESFDAANSEHKLLRLYIGLEDPGYLVADLEQAFKHIIDLP
jgi:cystathionine beta-lyase/cystathionine gamma-synthase